MTAELRVIELERQNADAAVIAKGLTPGETVVTDGQLRLVDGTKISIKTGPGAAAAKVEP